MEMVTSIATTMETAADAVMAMGNMNIATIMENMNIATNMAMITETAAGAATIMGIAMTPMPTVTMYRATLRTVTASCAILMRNTATYAARALTNVPVRCLTSIW